MNATTDIERTAAALVAAASATSPTRAEETAARCGHLFATLGHIHRLATRAIGSADKRARRASEFPSDAIGGFLTDVYTVLPKLSRDGAGGHHIRTMEDLLNGLVIPVRFTPTERVAFLTAYGFARGGHKPAASDKH
jgi:hypothetical protein